LVALPTSLESKQQHLGISLHKEMDDGHILEKRSKAKQQKEWVKHEKQAVFSLCLINRSILFPSVDQL
jgi:hypothetical protein